MSRLIIPCFRLKSISDLRQKESTEKIRVSGVIFCCLLKSVVGLTANWSGFAITDGR